jgi:hypothetical protein
MIGRLVVAVPASFVVPEATEFKLRLMVVVLIVDGRRASLRLPRQRLVRVVAKDRLVPRRRDPRSESVYWRLSLKAISAAETSVRPDSPDGYVSVIDGR